MQLLSDIEMQRMIVTTSTEIVKVMCCFYSEAFREIAEDFGFNLVKLKSVRDVLADSQMATFRRQIARMTKMCNSIG